MTAQIVVVRPEGGADNDITARGPRISRSGDEYLDSQAMVVVSSSSPWPWGVTLLATLFLAAAFTFGVAAVSFPVAVVRAQAQLLFRTAVVRRKGKELVLPEYIIMLRARDSDEALEKLRRMIHDPATATPGHVFFIRTLGAYFVLFCGFALWAVWLRG